MSFISLHTGKLHKKTEKKKFFHAGYVGKFYRDLADNVDTFLGLDFYGRITNDAEKYLLTTSDFSTGMQDDINHYVTRDRINNASFRQTLDPTAKNILSRQKPL